MGFFSSEFLARFDDVFDRGGGFLDIIGAGPSAWAGSADMWGGLGSRIGFEVALNGVFGGGDAGVGPGASLADRAEAAADAGEVVVVGRYAPEGAGEGEGVTVYDLETGTFVNIWDGGPNNWAIFDRPIEWRREEPWTPPPENSPWPPLIWAGADGGGDHGAWGVPSPGYDLL